MRFVLRWLMVLLCGVVAAGSTGCSLFDSPKPKDPFAEEDSKEKDLSLDYLDQQFKKMTGRGPNRDVAYKLFGEAKSLYSEAVQQRSKDPESSKPTFAEAAKNFDKAASRWPDSALEEEALYLTGECRFFADEYPDAEDAYARLLKQYPRTQYLDLVQSRRFSIAQFWLDLANEQRQSLLSVNATDDAQPWRDTFGHAMRVFDRIRLDDPTGKLADDATLALANAYFAREDFMKADEYYTDLRKTFPSSEHQFRAHFLGLKSKMESYQGVEYSGTALEESEKLLRQILRQFPVESEQEHEFLARAGSKLRYWMAEREWSCASFHERRAEYAAARMYYSTIMSKYGDTAFAQAARERVQEIGGNPDVPPQRFEWLVDLFPERETVRPLMASQRDASNTTQRR